MKKVEQFDGVWFLPGREEEETKGILKIRRDRYNIEEKNLFVEKLFKNVSERIPIILGTCEGKQLFTIFEGIITKERRDLLKTEFPSAQIMPTQKSI